MIILSKTGLIKMKSLYKMSYFPELHIRSTNKIKIKLDLSNDVTKSNLKNVTSTIHQNLLKRLT